MRWILFLLLALMIAPMANAQTEVQWFVDKGKDTTYPIPRKFIPQNLVKGLPDSISALRASVGGGGTGETNRIGRADTLPRFVFGAGGGNAGDTLCFSDTSLYGVFYNKGSDTLVVTSLYCVMQHGIGSDTIGIQVSFNDTLNAGIVTNLLASTFPVNSTTAGNEQTTITNKKVPPGNWIWMKTPTVIATRKPIFLAVTLSGYLKR